MLRESELFWLIGILEGEGYFDYEKWSQRVQVKMTDLDIIERVVDVFEKITGRRTNIHESPNKKKSDSLPYVIAIHGEDARKVMRMIVPYMGFRRRQRIWQSLNGHKPIAKGKGIVDLSDVMQRLKAKSKPVEPVKPIVIKRRA